MRILILTFYYRPDLCAGSFRTTPLVEALRAQAPPSTQIDVLTTLPNRYQTYTADARDVEQETGLEVRRIRLPPHSSDMLGQSKAFAHFAAAVLRHTRSRHYDLVFASSSRLMTAVLGAAVARRCRARLYLDIRDIFVDTIKDVLPGVLGVPARSVFGLLERWALSRADRINLVSEGFRTYFTRRYPRARLSWFTNGIDDEFIRVATSIDPTRTPARPAQILYAGNIGEGQGLHDILPRLAHELRNRARFLVIGDGGRRVALESAIAGAGLDNVVIKPPMPRPELLAAYLAADVLFLHLGAHEAFEKVLPSKLFEYAAMGKPVLAGVAGYAARFVREEITNAAVFAPCDVPGAIQAFDSLMLRDRPRPEFTAKYARANITRVMADDVLQLLRVE